MKNFAVISAIVIVFLGSLLYWNNQNSSTVTNEDNLIDESEDVATEPQEVEEEIKDGVYTNYKYGFQFEYDENTFSDYKRYGRDQIVFFKENGSSQNKIDVKTTINSHTNNAWSEAYEICLNDNNNFITQNGCLLIDEDRNKTQSESAIFKVKDNYVNITLWGASFDNYSESDLESFMNLVNSFRIRSRISSNE